MATGRLRPREAATQAAIMELATLLHWKVAHFHDSRREVKPGVFVGDAAAAGFPDLVLVRDRVIFAELKRVAERPRPDQVAWLNASVVAGVETYLWTNADIDEVKDVLTYRWSFLRTFGALQRREPGALIDMRPASMWLQNGRRDQVG